MTDTGFDFDDWYERFPAPAHPEWAERTERLATEASWPVRHLASGLLVLEARWVPRFRRLARVLRFLFLTLPAWIVFLPIRLVAALGRAVAVVVRTTAAVMRTVGRAVAGVARSTAAGATGVGAAAGAGARSLVKAVANVAVRMLRATGRGIAAVLVGSVRAPLRAAAGLSRVVAATVRVAARAPIRGGAAVARAVAATAHVVAREMTRGSRFVASTAAIRRRHARALPHLPRLDVARLARPARVARARVAPLVRRLEGLEPNDLVRPLQVAVSAVASLAILAAFAVAAHRDGAVTVHAALRSGSGAVLDGPAPSQPSATRPGSSVIDPFASSTSAVPTTAAPPLPVDVTAAAKRTPIPVGKGMWLYIPAESEGGDPVRIVNKAKANGILNLYVRTGSSYDGFYAGPFLDQLLPVAHAGGVRVIGWDFPYLKNADEDVNRAVAAINYTTPTGQRLDAFTADVEVGDGINLNPSTATTYSTHLRQRVGPNYPLIATVPKPNPALTQYPFAQLVPSFDAIAPMVYWLNDDPGADLTTAVAALKAYDKPIIPVGQAYDSSSEGGPKGVPGRAQIQKFIATADQLGAVGVSFWSWQAADQQAWDAVRDAPQFTLGSANAFGLLGSQVRCYQALLASLGYPVSLTAVMDPPTLVALRQYQAAAHLPQTALLDVATQWALLTPVQAR